MNSNSETVMGVYAAFGRGDVTHILDQMSEGVRWDHGVRASELSYLQPGTGKDHVVRFLTELAANVEFTTFEPGPPCASDDQVMVAVREVGRNVTTGAEIPDDLSVHIWTFGTDGKIIAFRHVFDIAAHEAAAQPVAAAMADG